MLHKRHYIAIAKAIKSSTSVTECNRIVKDKLIEKLVIIFGNENPNFSTSLFEIMCKTPFDKKRQEP